MFNGAAGAHAFRPKQVVIDTAVDGAMANIYLGKTMNECAFAYKAIYALVSARNAMGSVELVCLGQLSVICQQLHAWASHMSRCVGWLFSR